MPALADNTSGMRANRSEACEDPTPKLSARLVAGDEQAWTDFHARTFERLLRYLLIAAHGNEDAAREALQLTYVKCVRHVRRFENEGAMWGWLAQIARGCLIDLARTRSRYCLLLESLAAENSVEHQALEAGGFNEHLAATLERLEPSERTLIEACYFANQPILQIAKIHGTTPKAIESRLARIRTRLRAWLTRAIKNET